MAGDSVAQKWGPRDVVYRRRVAWYALLGGHSTRLEIALADILIVKYYD